MNILHMRYAVEVAKVGSINKASEVLLVAQPNLSRSIKELESDLGITIFDRSSKGMELTPEGEEFIGHAKSILNQIESVERIYKRGTPTKQRFSVSVPRSSYISEVFSLFSREISPDSAEFFYEEASSSITIKNVLSDDFRLGIVRYSEDYDENFKAMFNEKGLLCEMISEFHYVLAMHRDSTLSSLPEIHFSDLENLIEISHIDPFVPFLPVSQVKKEELPDNIPRRIFVFERACQFDLLSENKDTFMWVSPFASKTLRRYGLIQRECPENKRVYRDVLIHRKDYKLTDLDKKFLTELIDLKDKHSQNI